MISPLLNANEAAEFRSYWKTAPTQRAACLKYQIKPKQLKSWLAELDLQSFPSSRPQRTKASATGDDRDLAKRLQQEEEEPHRSIASRFRPQGQTTLNPHR
jgi:hypothetical protein